MKGIPREVTKVVTHSNFIRQMRNSIRLSSYQREVLIGTLLGDGSLISNAWGKNYRLQVFHSDRQRSLVEWKYDVFKNFTLRKPTFVPRNKAWRFRTVSHPELSRYHKVFYDNGKKVFPKGIETSLSPLALAVWFMDDGGGLRDAGRVRGYILNIQNFFRDDAGRILKYFNDTLMIKSSLQNDKGNFRLFIWKQGMQKMRNLIERHILEDFQYKLF